MHVESGAVECLLLCPLSTVAVVTGCPGTCVLRIR